MATTKPEHTPAELYISENHSVLAIALTSYISILDRRINNETHPQIKAIHANERDNARRASIQLDTLNPSQGTL